MSNADMITGEAAHRYAAALLELAEDSKSLKTIEKDMKTLKGLFAKSVDLVEMTNSPVVPADEQLAALLAIAKKAKLSKLATQFIGICVENRRASYIPEIIAAFEEKLARKRGTQNAQVISAQKLTAAQLTSIKSQLKKTIGRDVAIETQIDPTLLGGFAVKIGSRYFDSTLKTKLEGLKMAMKEA
jgi:F-type H+-transporting ATPase subunit delta